MVSLRRPSDVSDVLVAGGLLEAQDEAVAAALGRGGGAGAERGAHGCSAMVGGPAHSALGFVSSAGGVAGASGVGGYGRVGPEDVSSTPLERLVTAAEALDPSQFWKVQEQVVSAAGALDAAASGLRAELGSVLGGAWQGEFAQQGAVMVTALTDSAFELVQVLEEVASRADSAHAGFEVTRRRIAAESLQLTVADATVAGIGAGPGAAYGPPDPAATAAAAQARAHAEEQARAVVNTEYSPAVMRANLDDLQFPTAFRVVSGTALRDATNIDPVAAWNIGGVAQPAGAATPGPAALAAAGVGGPGPSGVSGVSGVSGLGADVAGPSAPIAATDAATEQALMASRRRRRRIRAGCRSRECWRRHGRARSGERSHHRSRCATGPCTRCPGTAARRRRHRHRRSTRSCRNPQQYDWRPGPWGGQRSRTRRGRRGHRCRSRSRTDGRGRNPCRSWSLGRTGSRRPILWCSGGRRRKRHRCTRRHWRDGTDVVDRRFHARPIRHHAHGNDGRRRDWAKQPPTRPHPSRLPDQRHQHHRHHRRAGQSHPQYSADNPTQHRDETIRGRRLHRYTPTPGRVLRRQFVGSGVRPPE